MKSSRLITKFREDLTARQGIEKAIEKQDEIDQREADRQAFEDSAIKLQREREADRRAIEAKVEQESELEKEKLREEVTSARREFEINARKLELSLTLEKEKQENEAAAAGKMIEDNSRRERALKEAGKVGVFIQSSIYDALKKHNNVNRGDTVSVIRMTTRQPVHLVVITVEPRQDLIPFLQKNYSLDFRIKAELPEADQSKEWVRVDDKITGAQYYIVSKR